MRSLALPGAGHGPCERHKITVSTNNGLRLCMKWYTHNQLVQFFTLGSPKIEVFVTYFFDIVATHSDKPTYVKHILAHFSIYVFFTQFGYWVLGGGGSPKGLVHNLLVQFFSLGSSKIKVFETLVFDVLTS